jgi:hypothetical protein
VRPVFGQHVNRPAVEQVAVLPKDIGLGAFADDCPPPVCGDRLCEWSERDLCAIDCNRYDDVSVLWTGDPEVGLSIADATAEPPGPATDATVERAASAACTLVRTTPRSPAKFAVSCALALLALWRRRAKLLHTRVFAHA